MDFLQTLGDLTRVYGNGATFGLADKFANAVTGTTDSQDRTAESRARLGAVGDIVSGGASLVGGGGLVKGARLAFTGARALPGLVAAAAEDAPAAGNAFRAGIQAMNPSPLAVAARAITVPNIAKTAAGAAALTAASGLANASRTGLAAPVNPAADAIANSSPIPGGPSYAELSRRANAANAAGAAKDAAALPAGTLGDIPADGPQNGFSHILDNFSAAAGGLSLHQLATLAQAQAHSRSPIYGYQKKPQTAPDKAMETLHQIADARYQQGLSEVGSLPAGSKDRVAKEKELLDDYERRLQIVAKSDPTKEAMANLLGGGAAPALAQ